ncbi:hypothetical protein ONZ45_g7322 [Pleurotus djamor]|nr:hypothetical protein ONZ45_g7322 [Pleurotus djamor]
MDKSSSVFPPSSTIAVNPSNRSTQSSNTGAIVGSVVGVTFPSSSFILCLRTYVTGIAGLAILAIALFFLIRWHNRSKEFDFNGNFDPDQFTSWEGGDVGVFARELASWRRRCWTGTEYTCWRVLSLREVEARGVVPATTTNQPESVQYSSGTSWYLPATAVPFVISYKDIVAATAWLADIHVPFDEYGFFGVHWRMLPSLSCKRVTRALDLAHTYLFIHVHHVKTTPNASSLLPRSTHLDSCAKSPSGRNPTGDGRQTQPATSFTLPVLRSPAVGAHVLAPRLPRPSHCPQFQLLQLKSLPIFLKMCCKPRHAFYEHDAPLSLVGNGVLDVENRDYRRVRVPTATLDMHPNPLICHRFQASSHSESSDLEKNPAAYKWLPLPKLYHEASAQETQPIRPSPSSRYFTAAHVTTTTEDEDTVDGRMDVDVDAEVELKMPPKMRERYEGGKAQGRDKGLFKQILCRNGGIYRDQGTFDNDDGSAVCVVVVVDGGGDFFDFAVDFDMRVEMKVLGNCQGNDDLE